MDRRQFLGLAAAASAAADTPRAIPAYKIVTKYKGTGGGMPGAYPGRVVSVHSDAAVDASERIAEPAVREMIRRGMLALTGDKDPRDSWARFIAPSDVVGIKINASGAPQIHSAVEVAGEIARNLIAVGVRPENIWVHERFMAQVKTVDWRRALPKEAHVETADSYLGYDPFTYVEMNFFGEEDTRSEMVRMASDRFTKIINVPNLKDHSASGVTGCLKNISYGEFSNVARSHQGADTNTYSLIGTLATVEPLRSRTVLQIMDGLIGVWHAGPFSHNPRFRFYPKRIMIGTDPVAIDRIMLDIIDEKRRSEKAISVWDRSRETLARPKDFEKDPNVNRFYREPGHIEYASKLGLGVYDLEKIKLTGIEL